MLSSFITALLIKVLLLLLFFVTIITFVITAFEKNFLSNKVKVLAERFRSSYLVRWLKSRLFRL
jgi:hypothetical protein